MLHDIAYTIPPPIFILCSSYGQTTAHSLYALFATPSRMLYRCIYALRFVLAATEHLHKRIAKMKERIRQLEDALAILQAKNSNEPHPLLRDDLLSTNTEHEEEDITETEPMPVNPPDIIDAFGTLSVSEHGVSRFFGPTGGAEVRCKLKTPSCFSLTAVARSYSICFMYVTFLAPASSAEHLSRMTTALRRRTTDVAQNGIQ